MPNNFLAQIYLYSFKGPTELIINRAAVLATIIEKYSNITGKVIINKEKKIEFDLENGKSKIKIIIDNPSWVTFKEGRKKTEGVFNRRVLIPVLDILNGDFNE